MKQQSIQNVQISGIVDTITDADKGRGLLGFVLTFPDGKMQNTAIEYDNTNHQEIALKVSYLYQKTKAKYGKVLASNSGTVKRKQEAN